MYVCYYIKEYVLAHYGNGYRSDTAVLLSKIVKVVSH